MSFLKNRIGCDSFALVAAVSILGTSAASHAVVINWNCNLVIPANSAGLFINVQSQQSGSTGASVLGWDFNVYSNLATPSLAFTPYVGAGFMRSAGALFGPVGNLPLSATVGSSGSFTPQSQETEALFGSFPGNWTLNSVNYFGFQFNADDGQRRYGFGKMTIGSTASIRTLNLLQYESVAGAPIVIPAPGALALIGLAGVARRRRRG